LKKIVHKVFSAVTAGIMLLTSASFPVMAEEDTMPDFSGLGAVGTLTEEQTMMASKCIFKALENHEQVVTFDLTGELITPSIEVMDSLGDLFGTIASQYEVGILANRHNLGIHITTTDENVAYVKGVTIDYQVEEDYETIYAEPIDKLDDISEQVHDDWSPVEKALFLHDYLAVHYNYRATAFTN